MSPQAIETLKYWQDRRLECARDLRQVRKIWIELGDVNSTTKKALQRLACRDIIRRAGFWAEHRPTRRGVVMAARECKPGGDAMAHCPSICGADDAFMEGLHAAWNFYRELREIAEELR